MENVVISGWILDPDRKKMSKSKGNVITPDGLLDQYSSDAVRYWASRARLGVDTAYDESIFKLGSKLTNKLFNASKFVLGQCLEAGLTEDVGLVTESVDLCMLHKLSLVAKEAKSKLEAFDYASALQLVESFFWSYCDDYLELVKGRSYGNIGSDASKASARVALIISLKAMLKLFAPFLPYITEEIWSWIHSDTSKAEENQSKEAVCSSQASSIHLSAWPNASDLLPQAKLGDDCLETLDLAHLILTNIRQKKTSEQKTLKWPVSRLDIFGSALQIAAIKLFEDDIIQAGRIVDSGIHYSVVSDFAEMSVDVKLSDSMES